MKERGLINTALFKIDINQAELTALSNALKALDQVRFDAVITKNATQMLNRARAPGGTPFDTGELRETSSKSGDEVGYIKEYAPHAEYGHRTKDGGFVYGQHYLQRNVDTQRPIFKQDLINALKKAKGK